MFVVAFTLISLLQLETLDLTPKLSIVANFNQTTARLSVTWTNNGDAPLLLTVGQLAGFAGFWPAIRLYISGPGVTEGELINTDGPSAIGGRLEYLVVCLPPRSSYSVSFRAEKLWLRDYKLNLADLANIPWTVTIRFEGITAFHISPDGNKPYDTIRDFGAPYPFWKGEIGTKIFNSSRSSALR